jgi:hypothetical protein
MIPIDFDRLVSSNAPQQRKHLLGTGKLLLAAQMSETGFPEILEDVGGIGHRSHAAGKVPADDVPEVIAVPLNHDLIGLFIAVANPRKQILKVGMRDSILHGLSPLEREKDSTHRTRLIRKRAKPQRCHIGGGLEKTLCKETQSKKHLEPSHSRKRPASKQAPKR